MMKTDLFRIAIYFLLYRMINNGYLLKQFPGSNREGQLSWNKPFLSKIMYTWTADVFYTKIIQKMCYVI